MSFFFGASLFSTGILIPYFPLILAARGLGAETIGYVLAAPYLLRLVALPTIAALAGRLPDRRFALSIVAAATFGMALAFGGASASWQIFVTASLVLLLVQGLQPVTEAIALSIDRRGLGNYGRMRLWGSATFIVANMAGGALLAERGIDAVFLALLATFAFTFLATFVLPPTGRTVAASGGASAAILRDRVFLAVLVAGGLIMAGHAALYGFASLVWQHRGYSEAAIGLFWAIGVVAEILLFAAGPVVFRHVSPYGLLVFAAASGTVRWLLFPGDYGPAVTALMQVSHAGTFACAHLGMMRFISAVVPDGRVASAQSTYVIFVGLFMAVSTALSGAGFAAHGAQTFALMAAFSAAALVLLLAVGPRVQRLPAAV